ncbi:MAG: LysR family transcriptional regulator, partial [Pseudomonadota bacterium]
IIKLNSLYAIYEAVRNHAGLAMLPDYLASLDNNIEVCMEKIQRPPVDMYFVYAEERKHSNRINILQTFLTDNFKTSKF